MAITNRQLAEKAIDIAKNYKTLYVMGCFGAPLTSANKTRYCANHAYNRQAARTALIKAASDDTFGFDCVNLIKGILWGWTGDKRHVFGGAKYASNGVPDINADGMISRCRNVSTTGWPNMLVGEAVWRSGHIGVYIGGGLAVECTPRWENKVQITAVANIGPKKGYHARTWTKHGKIPYITYEGVTNAPSGSTGLTEDFKPPISLKFSIGDTVEFVGAKHYSNTYAANGKRCAAGKAKVTNIAKTGKHPYHLVRVQGEGSTVYGWVDAADIRPIDNAAVTVGARVMVKTGAKTYTGGNLAAHVYSTVYYVWELNGDRAVIAPAKTGAVTAAMKVSDLILK